MKAKLKAGDRVRLVAMPSDPDPILVGQTGTVVAIAKHGAGAGSWFEIDVAWDNGRSLTLVAPPDEFEIVARA
jgi:hypothetical protein